jgi:hypothetical protein
MLNPVFRTKVRLKSLKCSNGATLTVLTGRIRQDSNDNFKLLKESAQTLEAHYPETLTGFLMIGWDHRGWHSKQIVVSQSSPYSTYHLPAFIAEIIRRHFNQNQIG